MIIGILSNELRELLDPSLITDIDEEADIKVKERREDIKMAYSLLLYHAKIDHIKIAGDIEHEV